MLQYIKALILELCDTAGNPAEGSKGPTSTMVLRCDVISPHIFYSTPAITDSKISKASCPVSKYITRILLLEIAGKIAGGKS